MESGEGCALEWGERGEHPLDRRLPAHEDAACRPPPLGGELQCDRAPVGADPPLGQAGGRQPVDEPHRP